MTQPAASRPRANERAWTILGALALAAIGGLALVVLLLVTVGRGWLPAAADRGGFLLAERREAAPIQLTDQDGRPFSLAALRGSRVLVFFGYTHCPDVCPATMGTVGKVLAAAGPSTRAVFVSVDPQRDTPAWLNQYVKYIPKGFTAVTGTPTAVRSVADDWGVRYARVETDTPGAYSMTHTADVYLVDAMGRLRALFPFGTTSDAMLAVVRDVPAWSASGSGSASGGGASASPPAPVTPAPAVVPTAGTTPDATADGSPGVSAGSAGGRITPVVVSTSVWAGGRSPAILTLYRDGVPIVDATTRATAQLVGADGVPVGGPVDAVTVRPPGETAVFFVPTLDIPSAGLWRMDVTVPDGAGSTAGSVQFVALDPGSTPALGGPAPDVRTPTLADTGGDPKPITTDPAPDLRLSRTSTADARSAARPYVLVVDSYRFKVTTACGKALLMARYLADRWSEVAFIHLEPYRYAVVTDSFVLDGTLSNPTVLPTAAAWGLGVDPWPSTTMPWVFVVDGSGRVVAKYQGVVGSADIDVILSMLVAPE